MMNRTKINRNADKVLCKLCSNSLWTFSQLQEATGLGEAELYMALAWLANDDRVSFVDVKNETRISSANIYI
jgi:hypothetical protein